MNRILFPMAALLGSLTPLVFDSALKGTILLAAAILISLALWRASAAARHLVWLAAIVALLIVPLLSFALPQWRVLPQWAAAPMAKDPPAASGRPAPGIDQPQEAAFPERRTDALWPEPAAPLDPIAALPVPAPVSDPHSTARVSPGTPIWREWLPLAWAAGFMLLTLRLAASYLLLRLSTRACPRLTPQSDARIATVFDETRAQLGITRRVTLLLGDRRAIPFVWGVFHSRLMLPAEARGWGNEQLRSVLLHELAHIKRRDTLAQWLAQIACALHWWNPLVWLAAWRLHVERERACDDLVLASGVRASAYAEFLLHVATKLSPARWTHAGGLAMARKSRLEGRLLAVLSEKLNRNGVTRALTAAALLLGTAIAIPVAMLRAADAPWIPPQAAHISSNGFGVYCVHDGTETAFLLVYHGGTSSSSTHDSNSRTRAWTDSGTFTANDPGIALSFRRNHTAPDKLSLSTAPAGARDLSKPAPPPRDFGQREYDLADGRVFLLSDNGSIRQLAIAAPVVRDQETARQLKANIAALPPQAAPAPGEGSLQPQHQSAQSLFRKWQTQARTDGRIPGALIGDVARAVDNFLERQAGSAEAKQLETLGPRFDTTRDWTQAEVVALLDEVTTITAAPVGWADLRVRFDGFRTIRSGQPLPAELMTAAWGEPADNGLRAAWWLEPRTEQYPLGTVLKTRVLFHNAGGAPVIFRTETWHQDDPHSATDARGETIRVNRTFYSGMTPMAVYRLMPGEYCEVTGHGIAIGAGEYEDERSTGRVGAVIEAKEGDEVSISHTVDAAAGIAFSRPGDPTDAGELWKLQVAERIASEAPLPKTAADCEQLIRRVSLDLTGVPPTPEEIAQFVNDATPAALDHLVARIQAKGPIEPWTGKLSTGTTKFRVIAADPDAAKAPRAVNGPGRYVLGDQARLLVSQITGGGRRSNQATIAFLSPDPSVASPHKPYEITLPDGIGTYGIVWERGAGELWVMEKGRVRKYDFTNPAQVQEVRMESGGIINIPAHLQDAMKKAFTEPGASVQQQNSQRPAEGAILDASTEAQLDWGETVNGLRGALIVRSPVAGKPQGIYLAVQNVSEAPFRFADAINASNPRRLYVSASGRILLALANSEATQTDLMLRPREVVFLSMMPADDSWEKSPTAAMIEGIRKDSLQTWRAVLVMKNAPAGAWTGTLTTGETRAAVSEGGPQPANPKAQALFKLWQSSARLNGDIPGGLMRLLHEKVNEFIRNNEPDPFGNRYTKEMTPLAPRFANTGDWKASDVAVLLDDIAAAHTIPLERTMEHLQQHTLQGGLPLPASLESADWGAPLESGLRTAFVLEPRAKAYPLGTEVKARILLHNSGNEPVAFVTTGFQQPRHAARLAGGGELALDSTSWTTRGRMEAYRLAPGEYCEIDTPGVGIGARNRNRDDWANVRAGSWIPCAEGDEVVFAPGAVMLWHDGQRESHANWWLDFITERLNREAPAPADTREREYLLYRVVRELYGAAPSTIEGDAFAADKSPDALKNLAVLLTKHPYGKRSHGIIRAGATTFRVLPADAAAKRLRVVSSPGRFTLRDDVRFAVTRRPDGDRAVNEASIIYFRQGRQGLVMHPVPLPDGHNTWAAGMIEGATEFWISENGLLRRYDFANPLKVEETHYEGDQAANAPIPVELREAMRAVLEASDAPRQIQEPRKPAAPAAEEPGGASAKIEPAGLLGFWRGKLATTTSEQTNGLPASASAPPRSEPQYLARSHSDITLSAMDALMLAVRLYESDTSVLPLSLDALIRDPGIASWKGPYLRGSNDLVDAWGTPYRYHSSTSGNRALPVIQSAGRDRTFDTPDDLKRRSHLWKHREVDLKPIDSSPASNEEYLDLDSGRRVTKSGTSAGLMSVIWHEQMDLALNCHDGEKLYDLRAFDLILAPAPSNHWDRVTPWEILDERRLRIPPLRPGLSSVHLVTLNRERDGTDTWFFRTREGGRGVLQILGSPPGTNGMKLRYKLLEQ